jgi:pyruvate kinase
MIQNPRPTRAELTDVANAIFDGTDAVMLSGESASGKYPVESVQTLDRIARTVETSPEYRRRMEELAPPMSHTARTTDNKPLVSETTSRMAYETAVTLGARLIITPTLTGTTARLVAKYRPPMPVLAVTPHEDRARQLLLDWGVLPAVGPMADNSDAMVMNARKIATNLGLAHISDRIVLAAGLPLDSPLPLNTVRSLIVGEVLARSGKGGYNDKNIPRVSGKIFRAETLEEAVVKIKLTGADILVCSILTEDYLPLARIVKGIICEGPCEISDEKLCMVNPSLVWLSGVHGASKKLEDGLSVTIDAATLLVYEGVI